MPAIYHTQMRLGHSCLNSHAFKFAFCDNDLCSCGQKETVTHYFLHCPIYAALRPTLLTSIANLISPGINYDLLLNLDQGRIIETILKGSPDLSYAVNTQIFKAVQDYIKMTKRFDCWINWRV